MANATTIGGKMVKKYGIKLKPMTIPQHVNYGEFYRQAISKGIKVTSKYSGVGISVMSNGGIKFTALGAKNGKRCALGYFPFDKFGEAMAHRRYQEYVETLPNKGLGRKRKFMAEL